MTPRIFVSSTYYDLRHVRERLEKFIDNYGFEPILFESDKVTYEHGKELDTSAYYEVNLCHLMILIIGGRYGTAASLQRREEDIAEYEKSYVSITRKELETALEKKIPVYIFIDKNVYSEYETYKENQDFFETLPVNSTAARPFKFAHVDNSNIFKFIDVVRGKPIKTFEKVEEIENYLKNQFSGLFYLYLESLKKNSDDNKILSTVSELNNIALRMNEMLSSVGKKILGKDPEEYESVIKSQLKILIDYFIDKVPAYMEHSGGLTIEEGNQVDFSRVSEVFIKNVLHHNFTTSNGKSIKDQLSHIKQQQADVLTTVNNELKSIHPHLGLTKLASYQMKSAYNKVDPFIIDNESKEQLKNKLKGFLSTYFIDLPF